MPPRGRLASKLCSSAMLRIPAQPGSRILPPPLKPVMVWGRTQLTPMTIPASTTRPLTMTGMPEGSRPRSRRSGPKASWQWTG